MEKLCCPHNRSAICWPPKLRTGGPFMQGGLLRTHVCKRIWNTTRDDWILHSAGWVTRPEYNHKCKKIKDRYSHLDLPKPFFMKRLIKISDSLWQWFFILPSLIGILNKSSAQNLQTWGKWCTSGITDYKCATYDFQHNCSWHVIQSFLAYEAT